MLSGNASDDILGNVLRVQFAAPGTRGASGIYWRPTTSSPRHSYYKVGDASCCLVSLPFTPREVVFLDAFRGWRLEGACAHRTEADIRIEGPETEACVCTACNPDITCASRHEYLAASRIAGRQAAHRKKTLGYSVAGGTAVDGLYLRIGSVEWTDRPLYRRAADAVAGVDDNVVLFYAAGTSAWLFTTADGLFNEGSSKTRTKPRRKMRGPKLKTRLHAASEQGYEPSPAAVKRWLAWPHKGTKPSFDAPITVKEVHDLVEGDAGLDALRRFCSRML